MHAAPLAFSGITFSPSLCAATPDRVRGRLSPRRGEVKTLKSVRTRGLTGRSSADRVCCTPSTGHRCGFIATAVHDPFQQSDGLRLTAIEVSARHVLPPP